ncbi:hypothetical protein [Ideonella sp. BN130291]|uniref:hypothetical protein n=1 Tax=Ideonella sp. BN130291 TaxID=3112940 RepID=UPI002E2711B1|nr:hypothetical protein [Ideonella sp. BN130291]
MLRVIALVSIGLLATPTARADRLATHGSGEARIVLTDDICPQSQGSDELMQAYRPARGTAAAGCWMINQRGNPVISWNGGGVQELDAAQVRLEPEYAALLRDVDTAAPAVRVAPARSRPATGTSFARPAWCKDARQPHERVICANRDLAAADLQLGPLWRAYRDTLALSPLEQARQKSMFFHQLKACGEDRACLAARQAERQRIYRDALAAAGH